MEPWTAEIEQSGLPIEKGRAYRGHVWVTSLPIPNEDRPHEEGEEEEEEGELETTIAVEVWLRYTDSDSSARYDTGGGGGYPSPTFASSLLARVVTTFAPSNNDDAGRTTEQRADAAKEQAKKEGSALPRDGRWRRVPFGFVADRSARADCECGVDPQGRADCAGDCRRGDGACPYITQYH